MDIDRVKPWFSSDEKMQHDYSDLNYATSGFDIRDNSKDINLSNIAEESIYLNLDIMKVDVDITPPNPKKRKGHWKNILSKVNEEEWERF